MRTLITVLCSIVLANAAAAESDVTVASVIAERGDPLYAEGFEHWNYVNPDAPRKGYITLGVRGNFDNFNRFAQRGTTPEDIRELLFDPLMISNDDEVGVYYGLVAEQVEYPASHEWIIFQLNPEATFQDGKPILASDVAFTFNLLMDEGVPQFRTYYEGVTAEVLSKRRVRFNLETGNKSVLANLATLSVFPEHDFKNRNLAEPFNDAPLGSGPYVISDYEMGQYVVYQRLDDYWALDHPTRRGTLNFEHRRYDYYLDETVLLQAFKKGEYDFRRENSAKRWATRYEGENFDAGHIVKEEIPHDLPRPMQGFAFNIQTPEFADRRVRMAINRLFDFEWTNENIFYGAYERTSSYFQNTKYMATDLPQGKELEILKQHQGEIPGEVFSQPYQNFQTDGSGNIHPYIREALGFLKNAGYEIRDGKMVHAESGEALAFELLLYSPSFERVAIPFKENLATAGITMNIRTVGSTEYTNRMRDRDYDMIVSQLGGGAYPRDSLVFEWDSRYLDSTYNAVGTKDPVIDELVRGIADNQQDADRLLAYGRAFDRVLLWRYYVVPHWHLDHYRVAYWDKFDRPDTLPQYDLGLDTWWVDPDAAADLPSRNAR